MNKCFIFGSMPVENFSQAIDDSDLIIAADKGLLNTNKFGITPHFIVGDFDSLGYTPEGSNIIKHPVMKNETDTILAVDVGLDKGYTDFVIYGCLGGRLDQTIASIQTAQYVANKGGRAVLIDGKTHVTVIINSSISFDKDCNGIISVFANSDKAEGVTETGLLYSLDDAMLTPNFPLGVSNEFIGENATVSVKKGILNIIWQTDKGTYNFGG